MKSAETANAGSIGPESTLEPALDSTAVWRALQSAEGSVRLAASALGVSVARVLEVLALDPNAVITARRASYTARDTGPLPVFRLWLDDEEDDGADARQS